MAWHSVAYGIILGSFFCGHVCVERLLDLVTMEFFLDQSQGYVWNWVTCSDVIFSLYMHWTASESDLENTKTTLSWQHKRDSSHQHSQLLVTILATASIPFYVSGTTNKCFSGLQPVFWFYVTCNMQMCVYVYI